MSHIYSKSSEPAKGVPPEQEDEKHGDLSGAEPLPIRSWRNSSAATATVDSEPPARADSAPPYDTPPGSWSGTRMVPESTGYRAACWSNSTPDYSGLPLASNDAGLDLTDTDTFDSDTELEFHEFGTTIRCGGACWLQGQRPAVKSQERVHVCPWTTLTNTSCKGSPYHHSLPTAIGPGYKIGLSADSRAPCDSWSRANSPTSLPAPRPPYKPSKDSEAIPKWEKLNLADWPDLRLFWS
jgi:hypothetical protein